MIYLLKLDMNEAFALQRFAGQCSPLIHQRPASLLQKLLCLFPALKELSIFVTTRSLRTSPDLADTKPQCSVLVLFRPSYIAKKIQHAHAPLLEWATRSYRQPKRSGCWRAANKSPYTVLASLISSRSIISRASDNL